MQIVDADFFRNRINPCNVNDRIKFSKIFAMPFMMTVAVFKADHTNRGPYTGIYSTAWSAVFIIAPILGTTIVTHFGFDVLWWAMSALALISMLGKWLLLEDLFQRRQLYSPSKL